MSDEKWKQIEAGPETDELMESLLGMRALQDPSRHFQGAVPIIQRCAQKMGYSNPGFVWRGPNFKPDDQYLTSEGYPLGTIGWYVYLECCGQRAFIVADTPALAVCRAVVFLHDVFLDALEAEKYPTIRNGIVKDLFEDIDKQVRQAGEL
jgi:hypothetical protein